MAEPWVWFVRGDLQVTAGSNALVVPIKRGQSDAQREVALLEVLAKDHPEGYARLVRRREGRALQREEEDREHARRRARAAQGRDPTTGGPWQAARPQPRGQGQGGP